MIDTQQQRLRVAWVLIIGGILLLVMAQGVLS